MNNDVKEDWLEALRSGQYYQARETLETSDGRQCCLGVLCDLLDIPKAVRKFGVKLDSEYIEYGGTSSELPTKVRRSIGITKKQEKVLIELNDDHEASFTEIADWIEVNL